MRTAIFLTIHFNNSRLPKKHLMEVNGETVTDLLIKRLKKCNLPIIMCSSTDPEDEKYLKPIADRQGIGWYAGEPTNIIKRHLNAAIENDVDFIVNVDADDVLACPEVINRVCISAKNLLSGNIRSNIVTSNYPLGLNILSYYRDSIKILSCYNNDTNWGAMIKLLPHYVLPYRQEISRIGTLDYRLTLDYIQDFEVIKNILENCLPNENVIDILLYLDEHPEVANINLFRNEEYWQRINKGGQI